MVWNAIGLFRHSTTENERHLKDFLMICQSLWLPCTCLQGRADAGIGELRFVDNTGEASVTALLLCLDKAYRASDTKPFALRPAGKEAKTKSHLSELVGFGRPDGKSSFLCHNRLHYDRQLGVCPCVCGKFAPILHSKRCA
jgi:hypothetical protein